MNAVDLTNEVVSLVKRAENTDNSGDALKFSQAAVNAANAMACLQTTRLAANGVNSAQNTADKPVQW